MEIPVYVEMFDGQDLTVRTGEIFLGPKLFVRGKPVTSSRGVYKLIDNFGTPVSATMKYNFIDPIPVLEIGEKTIRLAPPLKWYEYCWIGWPLLYVLFGGALGGFCGAWAMLTNARIFRSGHSSLLKYLFTAFISVGAFIIYMVIGILVYALVKAAG